MTIVTNSDFETFAFFEMTPDLVCIASKEGHFKKVNPAVINKLGYSQEELFARPIASLIHPDDRELTKKERVKLLRGKALVNFQNRYIAKNGEIFWFEWTSVYAPDKEIVFAIAKDVTERKLAEKEIEEKYVKFKGLASHFKSSLEQDRKYLAVELHEELAQLASVVKMDIDWIGTSEEFLSDESKNRIGHALKISDMLINTIRRISFSLSPNLLNDLGLNACLEWQCREFSVLNGIPCVFENAYDESDLSNEIKLDFFRICQEALTNVMYHAGATNVRIGIEGNDDQVCLCVIDDGCGFDIGTELRMPGLTNIRERVTSINGHLSIESEPGNGTKICVTIAKPGLQKVQKGKVERKHQ